LKSEEAKVDPTIEVAVALMAQVLSDFYEVCYVTEIEYVGQGAKSAVNLHFRAVNISIAKSKDKEGKVSFDLSDLQPE
jgi:hypothetical protein